MKFYWNTASPNPFTTAVAELTETIWPAKLQTFTVWPFTEKEVIIDVVWSKCVHVCIQKKKGKMHQNSDFYFLVSFPFCVSLFFKF